MRSSTRRRLPVTVSPSRPAPPAAVSPLRPSVPRVPTPDDDDACVWRTALELGLTPDEEGRWLWLVGEIGPRARRSHGAGLGGRS